MQQTLSEPFPFFSFFVLLQLVEVNMEFVLLLPNLSYQAQSHPVRPAALSQLKQPLLGSDVTRWGGREAWLHLLPCWLSEQL